MKYLAYTFIFMVNYWYIFGVQLALVIVFAPSYWVIATFIFVVEKKKKIMSGLIRVQ